MLEIRLLGKFDIRLDGQALEIASRPAQSLLAYLLVKPSAHRREKLAGLLWPDATETNARAYLRQALWRVRRALGSGGHDYILADDLTVAWNPVEYWFDVAELEREVAADSPIEEIVRCVSACQGELLPGFYDEWVFAERERLQAVYENKMGVLLERLVAARRWTDVLEWGERWVATGFAPEPAYRALMLAHYGLGDHSSMAATYQRCVEALHRELDAEPAEPTRTLYEQLLKGESPWEDVRRGQALAGNLPRQLTSFIGREREITELQQRLLDPTSRLVTLTGAGGCGKTRLALQAGQEMLSHYPQGVWLVELGPVTDPTLVAQAVAVALDLHEDPRSSWLTTIVNHLRTKKALLILDNCEHMIGASAQLAESLLQACAKLRILATSREALGVAGETVLRVSSLSTPDPRQPISMGTLVQYEAVRLFVERAAAVFPAFTVSSENAPAIAQICHRLDGIPLAIELAAARMSVLTVEQTAARLTDAFRLLTGGSRTALPRQQTLRATIDWSYNLLCLPERSLLCRLSVFAGGWTLEAAEAVCADPEEETLDPASSLILISSRDVLDLLMQLVNKSLVIAEREPGQEARYHLLETIRQYAREKLGAECAGETAWNRHLAYFVSLAERAESDQDGPRQLAWLKRLEKEADNIHVALEWSLESDVEAGLRLVSALRVYYQVRGYIGELAGMLRQLLQHPAAAAPTLVRARALDAGAILVAWQGDLAGARSMAEESLALYRELRDLPGEASGLHTLGLVACLQDDYDFGRPLALESLARYRELGDEPSQASVLLDLGALADRWDFGRAHGYLHEGLALYRKHGDVIGVAAALDSLGTLAIQQGHLALARRCLEESLAMQRPFAGAGIASILSHLGELALRQGDYAQAYSYYQESLSLSERTGQRMTIFWGTVNLGYVELQKGEQEQARRTFQEARRFFQEAGSRIGIVYTLEGLATLAARQGQGERAVRLLGWADATRQAIGDLRPPVEQASMDRDIEPVRAQLGPAAFAAAYEKGQAMTMDQAIAYAQSTRE
jgi:predicted ATPase/DNA-binding SARP family transcriptional activator